MSPVLPNRCHHGFYLLLTVTIFVICPIRAAGSDDAPLLSSTGSALFSPQLEISPAEKKRRQQPIFLAWNAADNQQIARSELTGQSNHTESSRVATGSAAAHWHRYLGYGSVLLAGLTAVSSSQEDIHEALAYATAGASIATATTGFMAYSGGVGPGQSLLSRDNLHMALGVVGAGLLTTAVLTADDGESGSHSGLGVAGGVLMTLGIIEIKW